MASTMQEKSVWGRLKSYVKLQTEKLTEFQKWQNFSNIMFNVL